MGEMCYRCMTPTVAGGVCAQCGRPALAPDSNGNALPLGTKLGRGRLTVGKVIGHGGFGVTYIAYSADLKRRVALKEFMPEYMADRRGLLIQPKPGQDEAYRKSMNSFFKEARALNELREHPNIVHVYSAFTENNAAYYTMELLEGESLLDFLKKVKKISGEQAFQLLRPIMDAIRYIHHKNILHRDISPGNIMLCKNPAAPSGTQVKLIDFGAAHVAIEGYSMSYPSVKTNGYSPLEQNWADNAQGPWMDVYSFCATVYSAVVGHVPPGVEVREKALAEGREDPMKPPSAIGGSISPALEKVLMQGLKLKYQERIQSMDQLIREVDTALGKTVVISEPHPVPRSREACQPTQMPQPVQEAPRPVGRRIAAWFLEQVLLGISQSMVIVSMVSGVMSLSASSWNSLMTGSWMNSVLLISLGFIVLDFILLLTAGGTLGQLLCGLRVRDEGGYGKASAGKCLVYALLYDTLIQLICGIIWLASGRNDGPMERMLHLSIVVRKPAGEPAPAPAPAPAPMPPVQPEMPPRTVPRPGNRVPDITRELHDRSATATLICVNVSGDAQMQPLLHKRIAIHDGDSLGKSGHATIGIPAVGVSRQHCSFHYSPQQKMWSVRDDGSTNGTFVDGVRLAPQSAMPVKPGAQIRVSRETFQIKY